jgi:hypothetical protein
LHGGVRGPEAGAKVEKIGKGTDNLKQECARFKGENIRGKKDFWEFLIRQLEI